MKKKIVNENENLHQVLHKLCTYEHNYLHEQFMEKIATEEICILYLLEIRKSGSVEGLFFSYINVTNH